jgi:antitoxin ParD1/3/4
MLCLDHLLRSFMPRTSRPVTVTLGDLQQRVKARVKSGAYASVSEVMRAAVRALEREEAAVNEWLRQRVDDAFADPRPNVPARDVFKRLRKHHAEQVKTARNEKI